MSDGGTNDATQYEDAIPLKVSVNEKLGSPAILPTPVQLSSSRSSRPRRKHRPRYPKQSARELFSTGYEKIRRRFGSGTAPPASSADFDSEAAEDGNEIYGTWWGSSKTARALEDSEEIDEIVVDREWGEDIKSCNTSDPGVEKSGGGYIAGATTAPTAVTDVDSAAGVMPHKSGFWLFLRWRVWPVLFGFFATPFMDQKSESQYKQENWYVRKPPAIWCAAFWVVNWVVSVLFVPKPMLLADKIFHYGIAPVFTFPIFFMVLFDFPRDRRVLYQVWLTVSSWMWAFYLVLVMYMCAYYGRPKRLFTCGSKDFLATFYYAIGPPVIALFGLNMERVCALAATITFASLSLALIVPIRTTWSRNVINFVFFHLFLLYLHYQRETAERRLYILRDQLKSQYKATQKAQLNERKAADSKRRLTSYVFHEVRVPLNTALLAVQNMAAAGGIDKSQEIEFTALEGSLSMMSKVLNDVLDFNRMDSGRFESVLRPYSFHQVMRSLFVPLRMATDARGLSFVTDLDRHIDEISRKALYEALGHSAEEVARKLADHDEDGVVVGDETRLRQIITNLASNACKFTPAGGQLTITTRLILPSRTTSLRTDSDTLTNSHIDHVKFVKEVTEIPVPDPATPVIPDGEYSALGARQPRVAGGAETRNPRMHTGGSHAQLSTKHLARHNSLHSKPTPCEWIVVRIEVADTGCGIRPKDMVQCKLFSAFNQTDVGRQQGGKGTGLGLALVRQIVKLSGGRLGVQSKAGSGSTFWVELPLGVGAKAVPFLSVPQFSPQTESAPRHEAELFQGSDVLKVSIPMHAALTTMSMRAKLARTKSAMHTIMDQGGLVEISTKLGEEGRIVTRTLGDPSTGTDPTPSLPLTTPESSPIVPYSRPPIVTQRHADAIIRPNFVQLPARHPYTVEEQLSEKLNSPISTPSGSTNSASMGWEAGLRVLVVDDDPLTRKLMARMLTRLGCKVSTAENGNIALDLILSGYSRPTPSSEEDACVLTAEALADAASNAPEEPKYAVVFLDNQMPVMSGLDMIARLRELGRKDFVVGVTGNALLDDQQEYYAAGVDHVLTKPVQEQYLKDMLVLADARKQRTLPLAPP